MKSSLNSESPNIYADRLEIEFLKHLKDRNIITEQYS